MNQTEIRFRPGQNALGEGAQHALYEMATPLDQRGYVIEVQGWSTGRGQAAIAASRRMADSVVRYLALKHGDPSLPHVCSGDGKRFWDQKRRNRRQAGQRRPG
jgi:hypothetical protein